MEHEVKYKNLVATYTAETAQKLKDDHGIDIEKELLDIMKSKYDKEIAEVAQR